MLIVNTSNFADTLAIPLSYATVGAEYFKLVVISKATTERYEITLTNADITLDPAYCEFKFTDALKSFFADQVKEAGTYKYHLRAFKNPTSDYEEYPYLLSTNTGMLSLINDEALESRFITYDENKSLKIYGE